MMHEIPVSELRAGDIGARVIAIDTTGNAYQGILTDLGATEWKYGKRPEEMVRIRIGVQAVEGSALKLESLPLDFRVQIERPGDEESS